MRKNRADYDERPDSQWIRCVAGRYSVFQGHSLQRLQGWDGERGCECLLLFPPCMEKCGTSISGASHGKFMGLRSLYSGRFPPPQNRIAPFYDLKAFPHWKERTPSHGVSLQRGWEGRNSKTANGVVNAVKWKFVFIWCYPGQFRRPSPLELALFIIRVVSFYNSAATGWHWNAQKYCGIFPWKINWIAVSI